MNNKKIKILIVIILVIMFITIFSYKKNNLIAIKDRQTKRIVSLLKKENNINSLLNSKEFLFRKTTFNIGEGERVQSIVSEEGTEKEKIIINQDSKKIIIIPNKNTFDEINGIKIGDSINKVIDKNGKDFYLYGFEWDYGGIVADWNNGRFKNGNFTLKFKIVGNYNDYIINNLLGDQRILTSNIDFSKVNIVVDEIIFRVE